MAAALLFGLALFGASLMAFLFSGMEAGVLALSRFRIRRQVRAGLRRAEVLQRFLDNPEDFLWTILVGNTLATVTAFSLMLTGLHGLLRGRLEWVIPAFAAAGFVFFVLCDLLPKIVFQEHPNRLCLALAMPFRLIHMLFSPAVAVLTWFSNTLARLAGGERFRKGVLSSRRAARLAIQETSQILTPEERAMVNRVLDLQDLTVGSIVVPLGRAVGVTKQTPVRDVLEICRRQPVGRLPVWDSDGPARRTVGIVSVSTLLFVEDYDPMESIARHARPPLQFREDLRLEEALRRMQRTRQRIAVVIGLDGRELGIVNLRDILKSIFGEVTL
jgi:putative hemolysin